MVWNFATGGLVDYLLVIVSGFIFDLDGIDAGLVVNNGAMHHVAYIDRLTRRLCKVLKNGGVYVGFDYTGAHRNQYSWAAWSSMVELNASLPERFRATWPPSWPCRLVYPHLKTMLHIDPTEAIHSELQIDVLRRYFNLEQFVPLGGAIAYQILFQNRQLYNERHTAEGIETLREIMDADWAFLAADPGSSLFSFWVATPKEDAFHDALTLAEWENEENLREQQAAQNGGRYYKVSALEIIYDEIACDATQRDAAREERDAACEERDAARVERDAARAERDAARAEHDAVRAERDALLQSTSWTITAPLRAMSSAIRRR
jgi:SAM-dependent methyltransferase